MSGFTPATRKIINDRAGGRCERCTLRPVEQHHHRRPRGAGGSKRLDTNTPANAAALCMQCHIWAESHRQQALLEGWLVRQGHSPATVPVLYHGTDWVLFTEDGGKVHVSSR